MVKVIGLSKGLRTLYYWIFFLLRYVVRLIYIFYCIDFLGEWISGVRIYSRIDLNGLRIFSLLVLFYFIGFLGVVSEFIIFMVRLNILGF